MTRSALSPDGPLGRIARLHARPYRLMARSSMSPDGLLGTAVMQNKTRPLEQFCASAWWLPGLVPQTVRYGTASRSTWTGHPRDTRAAPSPQSLCRREMRSSSRQEPIQVSPSAHPGGRCHDHLCPVCTGMSTCECPDGTHVHRATPRNPESKKDRNESGSTIFGEGEKKELDTEH